MRLLDSESAGAARRIAGSVADNRLRNRAGLGPNPHAMEPVIAALE